MAISKVCGKGGKTVSSFSHAIQQTVNSTATFGCPHYSADVALLDECFCFLLRVLRKRYDSEPVSMMCA